MNKKEFQRRQGNLFEVTCPTCKGDGQVLFSIEVARGGSYSASTGKLEAGARPTRGKVRFQTCLHCQGSGKVIDDGTRRVR